MSFFKGILTDLIQRRLWPVPVALIAAIVAVPVVLAKTPPSAPVAPASPSSGPAAGTPVASISLANSPKDARLAARARDPFTQQVLAKAASAVSGAAAATSGSAGATAVTTGGGSAAVSGGGNVTSFSGGSGASVSVGGGTTAPTSPAVGSPAPVVSSGAKPTPAPTGLSGTEAYRVALSVAQSDGSVKPIDPLERLSILPSDQQPLLVELGVLEGGHKVLFAVMPGTKVSGPGECTTGPIDCEIISLGQDQTETVTSGSTSLTFAVTAITADRYDSQAEAAKARQAEWGPGRTLLNQSNLSALSLFQYQPSVGAVVGLSNLTVGGN